MLLGPSVVPEGSDLEAAASISSARPEQVPAMSTCCDTDTVVVKCRHGILSACCHAIASGYQVRMVCAVMSTFQNAAPLSR